MANQESADNQNPNAEKSWGEIVGDLVFGFANFAQNFAESALERQKEKAIRKLTAFILLFSAALFILNGVSLWINDILNLRTWAGYLLVGLILFMLGLIYPKAP